MDLIKENNDLLLTKEVSIGNKERRFIISTKSSCENKISNRCLCVEINENTFIRNLPFYSALNALTIGKNGLLEREARWSYMGYTLDEIYYFNTMMELSCNEIEFFKDSVFLTSINFEIFEPIIKLPYNIQSNEYATLDSLEIRMYDNDGSIYLVDIINYLPPEKDTIERYMNSLGISISKTSTFYKSSINRIINNISQRRDSLDETFKIYLSKEKLQIKR